MNRVQVSIIVCVVIGLSQGARAESYRSAVENSLGQFPAGSIDRIPPAHSTRPALLTDETSEHFTPIKVPPPPRSFETFGSASVGETGVFIPAPLKLQLEQIPKFNAAKRTFDFDLKLGGAVFSTFPELKQAIVRLPKGSEIIWAPSCCLIGDEPLHANQQELKALCDTLEMLLIIRPGG